MTKIFKKLEKIVKISMKLSVCSDRLFVSSHGGGGGGGGGAIGERGGWAWATVEWEQQRGGGVGQ